MRPRRFSSAQRSGSIPVIETISEDLPWSTWPAVAHTRSATVERSGSVFVEIVTLQGIQDRARDVGDLLVGDGAAVEQHGAGLDPTEHRG